MIKVDESDPVGELEPSFPYKDITIRRGVDMKEHYELQSEIGRGKFGTVYKCREKATGLMLAAKFVGIVHKQDRRNVEREVEIMCELQHPRLIQLYDAFESNNAMCFVLELVEGGELFERVIGDDFVLTEKAVTIFMRQICEGVQFIHSKNILHLDLKPENILCLTKTGNRVKIIDFGLARKFNPENKLQVLFGTPEFVAPEVVNFDAIGFGTDMWSVGVICYVLLSGLSPFMGETDVETMANVTVAQYDFDDEAFDSISNDAKDFIKKLLVKDHKSRPSATECLSHRWMQKKKPKKTVRKNSSKKSVKETGEKPKPAVAAPAAQDVAVLPLDVSKENLRELCSRSRSQSPTEIATAVTPILAQLRIQRDSKSSKNSDDDGSKASAPTCEPAVTDADRVPPRPESGAARAVSVGSEPQTVSGGPQTAVSSGLQTAADEPQFPAPGEPTCASPATAVGRLQSTSERRQTSTMTSIGGPNTSKCVGGETTAKTDKDLFRQFSTGGTPQSTSSGLQTTSGGRQAAPANESLKTAVGDGGPKTDAGGLQPTSDGVQSSEAAGGEQRIESARSLQTTTLTANGSCSYRRSSDVSYMFSSFRTCTTTVQSSSGFLQGSNLRGLSERLQGSGCGENLHKLLQLNRQQLTATVADRRPKFKFTSRDVPVGSAPPASNLMYYMAAASSSCRSAPHSERASPEHESISAKEMLLKLFYGDTNAEPKLST